LFGGGGGGGGGGGVFSLFRVYVSTSGGDSPLAQSKLSS